jgi:hypothetical protein
LPWEEEDLKRMMKRRRGCWRERREGRKRSSQLNPRERKKKGYEDIFGSKTYKYPFP